MAEAVGTEARARNNYYTSKGDYGEFKGMSCLAPFINIMRHPLWGRVQVLFKFLSEYKMNSIHP